MENGEKGSKKFGKLPFCHWTTPASSLFIIQYLRHTLDTLSWPLQADLHGDFAGNLARADAYSTVFSSRPWVIGRERRQSGAEGAEAPSFGLAARPSFIADDVKASADAAMSTKSARWSLAQLSQLAVRIDDFGGVKVQKRESDQRGAVANRL